MDVLEDVARDPFRECLAHKDLAYKEIDDHDATGLQVGVGLGLNFACAPAITKRTWNHASLGMSTAAVKPGPL